MTTITITPGLWKMRNGLKARVAGINPDAREVARIVGWRNDGYHCTWAETGRYLVNGTHEYDLIEPWVDKPEWPKCEVSAWIKYIAQDASGRWYGYAEKPKITDGVWELDSGIYNIIPKEYAPTWTGDWTQSLIERSKV